MGRSRYKVIHEERPHFFTSTIVNWLPLFASPAIVDIIIDSWKFLQTERSIVFYAYIIMENHLHFIASGAKLGDRIAQFRSFTARQIIDHLVAKKASTVLNILEWSKKDFKTDRKYQVWQEGSHPEMISSQEMMIQKIEYIHYNPVKRGYVDEPVHWRYSSARNYADLEGIIEVCKDW